VEHCEYEDEQLVAGRRVNYLSSGTSTCLGRTIHKPTPDRSRFTAGKVNSVPQPTHQTLAAQNRYVKNK